MKNYSGEPDISISTEDYFSEAFEMFKAFSGGGLGLGAIGAIIAIIWSCVDWKSSEKQNYKNLQYEIEEK